MKLQAIKIEKSYQSRKVVDGVDLELSQGEIVGLLGPNGAGKTTCFYMIVGLIKSDSGKIMIDKIEVSKEPMYKRAINGIGYLAQEASVFRKLSVEDNIKAVLELGDLSEEEQKFLSSETLRVMEKGDDTVDTIAKNIEFFVSQLSRV